MASILGICTDMVRTANDGAATRTLSRGSTAVLWVVDSSALPRGAAAAYAPNFLRRDVVSLPPVGFSEEAWIKVRFVADNPGIWLFHCHSALPCRCSTPASDPSAPVDWHMHAGLATAVYEAPDLLYQNSEISLPARHVVTRRAVLAPR